MRTLLIVLLVLCVASVSLARRQHKKHHRRNWARVDDQVPQPPQPYYEPDVYYDPPISSDDNQNTNDGWENSDDWTKVEQRAPAAAEDWSNVRQEAPVDDGWSNPAVDPVDPGFENPEVVNPVPVDQGFDNSGIVDSGFENPEVVDSVPVDEAWGKEEEVNQNAWVEEREQPEVAEDPSEVDWQEAQQERKPWFDEQVEIRHEKPSPSLEEYDDGFEEEPVEAIDDIDDIDMVGVDSFDDTDGEIIDDITEEDLWENSEGLDTSEELYGDESESAEYSSETSEENMDTSEELYGADSESQGYSSETSEKDIYGKRNGWNGQEVDNDAKENEEADILWPSTTPADIGEPEAFEVLGQRWRAFTAWHYALFAVAGAVFLVGFMIIVVTAIRACRYRKPMYRRLETEKLPVAV